jgi:hypothetical protein
VEVDGAARLEFRGFAVGDPDRRHRPTPTVRIGHAKDEAALFGELGEVAFDGLFGAPP